MKIPRDLDPAGSITTADHDNGERGSLRKENRELRTMDCDEQAVRDCCGEGLGRWPSRRVWTCQVASTRQTRPDSTHARRDRQLRVSYRTESRPLATSPSQSAVSGVKQAVMYRVRKPATRRVGCLANAPNQAAVGDTSGGVRERCQQREAITAALNRASWHDSRSRIRKTNASEPPLTRREPVPDIETDGGSPHPSGRRVTASEPNAPTKARAALALPWAVMG